MINRLIILGNGFDLAHGLKTKYCDFLKDYYSKLKHSSEWSDEFYDCKYPGMIFNNYTSLDEILKYLGQGNGFIKRDYESTIEFERGKTLKINNDFFFRISKSQSINNWVDIENEYFKYLIAIIDNTNGNANIKNSKKETVINDKITTLNREMDEIALRFEKYLTDNVLTQINSKKINLFDNILINKDLSTSEAQFSFYREFPQKILKELRANILDHQEGRYFDTLVLNFNYTKTMYTLYSSILDTSSFINIHGELNSKLNPINLGFGDEMSKRYGEIEDFNNNEFLRLMKSFAYSNTDNYKRLFDFIESGKFQLQIMGHSCGTSDRTMLNAIFENHNCKSIKVFYHKGENYDNYSDIVRNISRHFNQKTMMREKIVNKEYCVPLPQFIEENIN